MEALKHKGHFFLPDNKEVKIPGILTFSYQEGIILELIGTLSPKPSFQLIILGLTTEGKSISLYINNTINTTFGSGITATTYKSRYLFVGINFDYKRDLSFRTLECNFNVLGEWLFTENLLKIKFNESESITITKPGLSQNINVKLNDDWRLIFNSSNRQQIERNPLKYTVQETFHLKIVNKKRIQFDRLLGTLKQVQNLLTFASQKPAYPEDINIYFRVKNNNKVHLANLLFSIPNFVKSSRSELSKDELLFSFSAIPNKIESVVYKWFASGENLVLIMNEFCSQFYNPKMYQEDKFLSMTTCLESFHREFRIKGKISNLNRYKSLFEEGRSAFNWLLKIPSKNKFCQDLKDFRNDLTHNNPERLIRTRNIDKLYRLTEYAKVIVVTVIIKELGLTNAEIKQLFQKSRIFKKL